MDTVARQISDAYAGKLHPGWRRACPSDAPTAPGARENRAREAPGEGGTATTRLTARGLKGVWSQIGRAQRARGEAIKGMRQNKWLYPTQIMA